MTGEHLEVNRVELPGLEDADISVLRSNADRIKEELASLLKKCPTMRIEDVCSFFRYIAGKCICINEIFERMVFDDQFNMDIKDMLVNLRVLNLGAGESEIDENVKDRVESIVGYFFISVENAVDLLQPEEREVEVPLDNPMDNPVCKICRRIKNELSEAGEADDDVEGFCLIEDLFEDEDEQDPDVD